MRVHCKIALILTICWAAGGFAPPAEAQSTTTARSVWSKFKGHTCWWWYEEKRTPVAVTVELTRSETLSLGHATCSKRCAPCKEHSGPCRADICFTHRPMPLEATITDEDAKSSMTKVGLTIGSEFGGKLFGVGMDVEITGEFAKEWGKVVTRTSGISKTIPPICLEPACKESFLPVYGTVGGDAKVTETTVRVDWRCFHRVCGDWDYGEGIQPARGYYFEKTSVTVEFRAAKDIDDAEGERHDQGECTCTPPAITIVPPLEPPPRPPTGRVTPTKPRAPDEFSGEDWPTPTFDDWEVYPDPPGGPSGAPWMDFPGPRWREEQPRDERKPRDEGVPRKDTEDCPKGQEPPAKEEPPVKEAPRRGK